MRCLIPTGFLVQESQHFGVYQCVVWYHQAFWYGKVNVLKYLNALFIPIGRSGTGKSTFWSISMRCLIPPSFLARKSQRFEVSQFVVWYQRGFWYRKVNVLQYFEYVVCSYWAFWYRKVEAFKYISALFIPIGHSGTVKSTFSSI